MCDRGMSASARQTFVRSGGAGTQAREDSGKTGSIPLQSPQTSQGWTSIALKNAPDSKLGSGPVHRCSFYSRNRDFVLIKWQSPPDFNPRDPHVRLYRCRGHMIRNTAVECGPSCS